MSGLYSSYAEDLIDGSAPNLVTADVRAVLIDTADYTFSAAHDFLDDVAVAARVGTPVALANKSASGGVFSADPTTIVSVSGDPTEAVILFIHTGSDATAALLMYLDGASVEVTPNGEDININWHANGIQRFVPV